MLSNQQIESFIYSFRQSIEALQAGQLTQNGLLNALQTQLNNLPTPTGNNTSSGGAASDSYPVAGGILHKLVHTFTNNVLIQGILSLTSALKPSSGGTGRATLTAHAVVLGEGTSNVNFASPSTAGFLLTDNGAAADPTFQAPATRVITFNTRSGVVTLTKADVDAVEQALGTGDSPTFVALTLSGLAALANVQFNFGNTTGAGAALLGANSPASTLTAPYTWLTCLAADGSTVYIPCWK